MGKNFILESRKDLCPILFNIFLCDLLLFIRIKDVASYADENSPYETGGNSTYVYYLEILGNALLNWFNGNSMIANLGKYHPSYLVMIAVKSQSQMKEFPAVNAKNF